MTKVKLVGNIDSTQYADGNITFKFKIPETEGNVETKNISAKPASMEGALTLKKLAAQDIRLGSRIKIEISIIDPSEEGL